MQIHRSSIACFRQNKVNTSTSSRKAPPTSSHPVSRPSERIPNPKAQDSAGWKHNSLGRKTFSEATGTLSDPEIHFPPSWERLAGQGKPFLAVGKPCLPPKTSWLPRAPAAQPASTSSFPAESLSGAKQIISRPKEIHSRPANSGFHWSAPCFPETDPGRKTGGRKMESQKLFLP